MTNSKCLQQLINLVDPVGNEYDQLLSILWDVPFRSLVDYDDNRIADAMDLRSKHPLCRTSKKAISVLEVLISLSERMAFITSDLGMGEEAVHWFWKFIEHLELDSYVGELDDEDCAVILEIAKRFVLRKYEWTGYGGIFPLNDPQQDQREVELWYQMQAWITENVSF